MELKAVCGISMSYLRFKIRREIYDIDGTKGTFLRADAASNTQGLADECNLRIGGDFLRKSQDRAGFSWISRTYDTQFSAPNNRTTLFALLPTFFWFALIVDTSNQYSSF